MKHILNLSNDEISKDLVLHGQPKFRTKQVWEGLYKHMFSDFSQFTTLPNDLRNYLDQNYEINALTLIETIQSKNKDTAKSLYKSSDKSLIESVLMKYSNRRTACISTQAGCAVGCKFCATGQMGFKRSLSAGEIIEQVLFFERYLSNTDEKLTNIVFMGMGEPFLNFDATIEAINRLNDPLGFKFGERRFTISTVGIVPGIIKFAELKSQVNLAISLHAANDFDRNKIIPINKKHPIKELITACKYYTRMTKRRITFEWALINDVNDNPSHAMELVQLIKGMLAHVNLIPLNSTGNYKKTGTDHKQVNAFAEILKSSGIPVSVRIPRGLEINAGCGQLAAKHINNK